MFSPGHKKNMETSCFNRRETGQYRCFNGNKPHKNLSCYLAVQSEVSKSSTNRARDLSKPCPYKINAT
jgi:hypothetical protein